MLFLVGEVLLSFKWAPAMQRDGKLLILWLKTPPKIPHSTPNNRTTDRSSEVMRRYRERTAGFLSVIYLVSSWDCMLGHRVSSLCPRDYPDHHLEVMKECHYSSTVNVRNVSKCQGVQAGCWSKRQGAAALCFIAACIIISAESY